jgi:hypothetical protein
MEADWEFEVGGDAPVIDACWSGFVDLRLAPERAWGLVEVGEVPALAAALERLNSPGSQVWTSKCDFWPELGRAEFDPDELDAPPGSSAHAVCCYVDILSRDDRRWPLPHLAEAACRHLCDLLATAPLRCCRIDLVIRRATIIPDRMELGVTAYVTACGSTPKQAMDALGTALAAFADALCAGSTLERESMGE